MIRARMTPAVVILAIFVATVAAQSVTVQTPYGAVQGMATDTARSFKGIPYAEPPVGALRWAPVVSKKPWSPNTIQAMNYGHGCPQRCELPPFTCPDTQSEDCLTLNIFTPAQMDPQNPAPVMVFLPGGRFEQGASGSILYDGSLIANRSGVIMVTSNYRLGVLGWLATSNGLPGNFGLEDQREALRFLQKIIPAFGGNPNLITLFGQSAGATSTATHLTSPRSKGLFQRAIIQSGPLSLPNKPMADANWLGDQFAQMVGCAPADLNCFRALPVDKIVDAQKAADQLFNLGKPLESGMPWVPVVDTSKDDVVGQPLALLASGQFQKMPIIMGSVWQDCLPFIYMGFKTYMSDLEYSAVILTVFPQIFQQVMNKYPPTPVFGDKRPWLGDALGTDYIFDCPTRYAVQNVANALQGSGSHVYLYNFNQSLSFDAWGPNYTFCQGNVCHGVELPYLFDSARNAGFHPTPAEDTLSRYFGAYWTNFARTGDPNLGSQPNQAVFWPPYDASRPNLELSAPHATVLYGYRNDQCSWWDTKGYTWGWANNDF